MSNAPSVSSEEIAHFGRMADDWWDLSGPLGLLHNMNPLRTGWNHKWFSSLTPADPSGKIRLLDIGCGAGIASEAYARMGYDVTGLDASDDAINAARAHQNLSQPGEFAGSLTYRHGAAEDLVAEHQTFDVVSALEVIEHVTDPEQFVNLLSTLTRPGGIISISTLNRTLRSLLVAKIGVEYVLRHLPVGTHQWGKFVKPAELVEAGRKSGLKLLDITGVYFLGRNPHLTKDTSVNYLTVFRKL